MSTEKQLLYSNGNVFIKYSEDDEGKKQGEYVKFFINNDVEEKGYYKDNLLEGEYVKYFKKDALKERSFYKDNLLHGISKKYELVDGESKLVSSASYNNGKLDGLSANWSPNSGKPTIRANYKDGKKNGEYMEWYPDGSVYMRCFYENDKLLPESKKWFDDGTLQSEFVGNTNFIYDSIGLLKEKNIYDENYDLTKTLTYYPNKKIKSESDYKDGKITRTIIFYDKTLDEKIKSIIKIIDYVSETITVEFSFKDYVKRDIISLNSRRFIKSYYVDFNGQVIPSFIDKIKNLFCKVFNFENNRQYRYDPQELELLNKDKNE